MSNILNKSNTKLITMTKQEMTRYQVIKSLIDKNINIALAKERLNLSERQIKRLKQKVSVMGVKGVIHASRGKRGNRQTAKSLEKQIVALYKEKYPDFNLTHFSEKISENHGLSLKYGTVKNILICYGLYQSRKRKTVPLYFSQRQRKEYYGQMQQFDGSYHDWFEGRCLDKNLEKEQCLLLSVDDASGKITHACFGKNESVQSVFLFWRQYLRLHGKPLSIYLDRFSSYKVNHKNAVDNRNFKTQFQRALNQLGIEMIFAYSPQAKGRVERMNKTLQDRLIKEMRLKEINNIKQANEFLQKEFIPEFNRRFAVVTQKPQDVHLSLTKKEKEDLDLVLCVQNKRMIKNDFTIHYKNRYFQLEEIQPLTLYKKDNIMVKESEGKIYLTRNDKILNFRELPTKPHKEIEVKLPAITPIKIPYKPPEDHPWRKFKISGSKTKSRH